MVYFLAGCAVLVGFILLARLLNVANPRQLAAALERDCAAERAASEGIR